MEKRIYMKMGCVCFLIIIALSSCINHGKTTVLKYDSDLSTVYEKRLIRDSIVIHYYSTDSILLLKYSNGDYKQSVYFKMGNAFFERRISVSEIGEFVRIDSVLTFSKSDTVFGYKSARKFIPTVLDLSYADCIYTIKHESNGYMSIKQSVIDTTYKEIYFYDMNYNIFKYINTWKDNKCVYVRKE